MTEILSVCFTGALEAAAQMWFAQGFLGLGSGRKQWIFTGVFCLLGGIFVNLLPVSGTVKLLIYSLLLYGLTRAFSGNDGDNSKGAAVCTVLSVTVMQGCFGVMGCLSGLVIIGALRCGIMLRGEWLSCLFCLLPLGLFLLIGGKIMAGNFGWKRYEDLRGKYKDFPIVCILPVIVLSVYINSVVCVYADTDRVDILPGVLQLTVILAAAGLWEIWRKSETAYFYREYCERMNVCLNDTAIIRHDLKNHMLTIGTLARRGEFEELRKYAEKFSGDVCRVARVCNTGAAALDALIDSKLYGVGGVKIDCKVQVPRGCFDETDMCGIFGNALDNALAGCKNSGGAFIDLRTIVTGDMLLIECKNSCNVGSFKEGTGLRSIRRTAAKYGGCVTTAVEDGVFVLRVLLDISRRNNDSSRQ
ncbi:MAG: ATP-binding protein [Oscillospiraceae bacterium]|nr:ATP-binding protein [Oscillospiraceae bacterium]